MKIRKTRVEQLTREQEYALIKEYQATGCRVAERKLLASNAYVAKLLAKKFSTSFHCDYDELYQVGLISLYQSFKGFDPSRGTRLATYAWRRVKQQIKHSVAWQWSAMAPKTVDALKRRSQKRCVSLDAYVSFDNTLHDFLGASDSHGVFESTGCIEQAWWVLNKTQRQVLVARFGGDTLKEVANQFSLTRERIRQIESEAMQTLSLVIRKQHPDLVCGPAAYGARQRSA